MHTHHLELQLVPHRVEVEAAPKFGRVRVVFVADAGVGPLGE